MREGEGGHPRQEEQCEEKCQDVKVQMEEREGGIIQWAQDEYVKGGYEITPNVGQDQTVNGCKYHPKGQ